MPPLTQSIGRIQYWPAIIAAFCVSTLSPLSASECTVRPLTWPSSSSAKRSESMPPM